MDYRLLLSKENGNYTLTQNDCKYQTGDKILFRLNNESSFQVGSIYIKSVNSFYLLSNNILYNGDPSPQKLGYSYSWVISPQTNGLSQSGNEKTLSIFKIKNTELVVDNFILTFLSKYYGTDLYQLLFNVDGYNKITQNNGDLINLFRIKNGAEIKTEIKFTRFIKSLLKNDDVLKEKYNKDTEIEIFSNRWKSFSKEIIFEIKKGKDIVKGYSSESSKIKSCMVNKTSQLDLYSLNEDRISLFCFYHDGDMIGRTITWLGDDGELFHDRLYSTHDHFREYMFNILTEKGYKNIFKPNKHVNVKVTLSKTPKDMPYLDSLKNYKPESNKLILSNYII